MFLSASAQNFARMMDSMQADWRRRGQISSPPANDNQPETLEDRIARYLHWAGEATQSGAQARRPDLRDAHLAVANSWMRLADEALDRALVRA